MTSKTSYVDSANQKPSPFMDRPLPPDVEGIPPHPSGLYVLFGAEAWERFSYYGMRALLTLYLTSHLKIERGSALAIYGLYTSLVYVSPLFGGLLADKYLGRRKAVLIGGSVMALGHLAMVFEPLLQIALGLLIVGNGFFKPNISTMVGGLYKEGDERRDGAFTIFYMGINLGAFFSPIVCGFLGENVGWHVGFSAATIGMVIGLLLFAFFQRHLLKEGMPPNRKHVGGEGDAAKLLAKDYVEVGIWAAVSLALVSMIVFALPTFFELVKLIPSLAKWGLAALALFMLGMGLFQHASADEAKRLLVVVLLCIFNIAFWLGFEQAGGTMTLFAKDKTDRILGGRSFFIIALLFFLAGYNFWRSTKDEKSARALWIGLAGLFGLTSLSAAIYGAFSIFSGRTFELPASLFQSINPMIIVALAPTFSNLWAKLDAGRFKTATPTKMAIGMLILGLGFAVLYTASKLSIDEKVSPAWLAAVYAIHTIGELCLSPIGLSMVTKLAPERVTSFAMAIWLGSSAIANYLAAKLESMLETTQVPLYGFLIITSMAPALLLLLITPILKKWIQGKA